MIASSPTMASCLLPTLALLLGEAAGIDRSIDIVFSTPFSLMVSVYCWTLIMRYGQFSLGSNLSFFSLTVASELFVAIASGLSTYPFFVCFEYRYVTYALLVIVLVSLLRRSQLTVNLFCYEGYSSQKAVMKYSL